jgi:hypothetical protein
MDLKARFKLCTTCVVKKIWLYLDSITATTALHGLKHALSVMPSMIFEGPTNSIAFEILSKFHSTFFLLSHELVRVLWVCGFYLSL